MRHRLRFKTVGAAIIVLALDGCVMLQPAQAQGFFESLFGWGGASKSQPAPSESGPYRGNPILTPGGRSYAPGNIPARNADPQRSSDDDDGDSGQKFRTVCVRMCDGYYFPISFSTTRKNFYRDGQRCRAQCGDEARVFHVPSPNGEIEQAMDTSGKPYSRLPNAFKYRKAQVEGCACRPSPWSEAETERHRRYAEADARAGKAKLPDQVAGKSDAAPSADAAADASTPAPAAATPKVAAVRQKAPAPIARAAPPPRRPVQVAQQPIKSPGFSGGMGLGAGTIYAWPGDAQRR